MKFKLKVTLFTAALIVLAAIVFHQTAEAGQYAKKSPPGHAADWICLAPFFNTRKWCHARRFR